MAYSTPVQWSHGDTEPTAAQLNKYKDNDVAIYAALGDEMKIAPAGINAENGPYAGGTPDRRENSRLIFVHKYRWLYFRGTGDLYSFSAAAGTAGDDLSSVQAVADTEVALTDSTNAMNLYDLSDVTWLSYGQAYQITGLDWAIEVEDI